MNSFQSKNKQSTNSSSYDPNKQHEISKMTETLVNAQLLSELKPLINIDFIGTFGDVS
jgi:hypothetical protein